MKVSTYGNPVSALTDKNKGDMGNRMACAAELTGNNIQTGVKLAAVGAASGAAIGVMHNSALSARVSAVAKDAIALVKKHTPDSVKQLAKDLVSRLPENFRNIAKNGLESLKKNKLVALIIAAGTVITGIVGKGMFKAGRIEQKYEDRAAIGREYSTTA